MKFAKHIASWRRTKPTAKWLSGSDTFVFVRRFQKFLFYGRQSLKLKLFEFLKSSVFWP
jgi:hypothetical protein